MATIKEQILSPALRAVGQETKFKKATIDDYNDAFRFYQEMLNFWADERNVELYALTPEHMDESVSTGDPVRALKENLIVYIADHFFYEPTPGQKNAAASSFRAIKGRNSGPVLINRQANQPRGSGNRWYKGRHYGDCGGSRPIVTQTDVQIVTND